MAYPENNETVVNVDKAEASFKDFLKETLPEYVSDIEKIPEVAEIISRKVDSIEEQKGKLSSTIIKLFVASYFYVAVVIVFLFFMEKEMIEQSLLDAQNRSINSTVITALIAATFTQAGAGFILLAKHLFGKK